MNFDDLTGKDLLGIAQKLESLLVDRGVPYENIQAIACNDYELEIRAHVAADPAMDLSGNAKHRTIDVVLRAFMTSPETDREVLFVQITYSVAKEFSNFFPVPAEYGDRVAIQFGWEFDRETLDYGAAEVRERGSLHFVSVCPNPDLIDFVQCCSEVIEDWS